MNYPFIAIEREYGSGGTKIARRLAEVCNIPCYGQEIIEAVSLRLHVPTEQIQKYEESVTNSFLYTTLMLGKARQGDTDMLSNAGRVSVAEQQEIKSLAADGCGIFIGHCAAEALKDRRVFRVFIHCSDEREKSRRIAQDYAIPAEKIESTRKYFDNKRAKYYSANTTKKWADLHNYDLVLDSASLGIEGCVALLAAAVGTR